MWVNKYIHKNIFIENHWKKYSPINLFKFSKVWDLLFEVLRSTPMVAVLSVIMTKPRVNIQNIMQAHTTIYTRVR